MSVSAFSRYNHLSELDEPLFTGSGVMTPAERKAAARDNLGVVASDVGAGITGLTDNSGGTAGDTIADVPTSYTEATLANQIASLTNKINEIIVALGGTDPNA